MEKPVLKSARNPWSWIPTLYFTQGIPYTIVMAVSVIMYKRFGLSNTDIAFYTSWLYLPWVIKPLWSPFVDLLKTKRWWVITMQLFMGAGMASVALLIPLPFYIKGTLALLWLIAFSSATHDIAADGFYMLSLTSSQQSFFVGIRSTFYRFAMITGQGLLIIIAGSLESSTGLKPFDIEVKTSATETPALPDENSFSRINETTEMTFMVFPETLVLNTAEITTDSLSRIKNFAAENNHKNGFVIANSALKKTGAEKTSWWTRYVAMPLSAFIKNNFGEKEKLTNSAATTGNASVVAVRLTKKPEPGKKVILNTRFTKGDKSISLLMGERLEFTETNWEKPAYLVFQADKKLKNATSGSFRGVSGNIKLAWSITFFILAGFFILAFLYHRFILPKPDSDKPVGSHSVRNIFHEFGNTFATFFKKPGIVLAIIFMLFYRLGEAFLIKMASPFLLDGRETGGLGLTTGQVGLVYGTVGVLSLTIGGIVGGIAASRKGLKYWIWPMALSITLPHFAYIYLSMFTPDNFFAINAAVAVEQFGYGFGFTAYMLYMIYFADGEHKTAHYAICTGFMALGMMLPGMIAGWLQDIIGYYHFFIWVMVLSIPTLLLIPFLKIDRNFGKKQK